MSSKDLLNLLDLMTRGSGWPGDDDEVVIYAIEFWNEYAEFIVDYHLDGRSNAPLAIPIGTLESIAEGLVRRIRTPPSNISQAWDEDTRDKWEYFREDVFDFFQKLTTLPGTQTLVGLGSKALGAIHNKDWPSLEAALSCLNAIVDAVVMDEDNERALGSILASTLFGDISSPQSNASLRSKKAVLKFVDSNVTFVQKHAEYLPPILTFLLTTLESCPAEQTKLSDAAAKSLEVLCSSCRKSLTGHMNELLDLCPSALSGPAANTYQKERVLGALASVVEALPHEAAKAQPLIRLIVLVEHDLNAAMDQINRGNIEESELLGTTALQCLASMGKGLQAHNSSPIDLESDGDDEKSSTSDNKQFWVNEQGQAIQQRILSCFNIVDYLRNQGDAMEAACAVLRSGLAETTPGPFVFPPSVTAAFICKAQLTTPRVEAILITACTFVSAHSRRHTERFAADVFAVYQTAGKIMLQLADPREDPQVAQLCLELMDRLTLRYADVLLAPPRPDILALLAFALRCLAGDAPMLKRSAASFFASLVDLAGPKAQPSPEIRAAAASILSDELAPPLAACLVGQIGGLAQRSELDALCKVLRAFVAGVPAVAKRCIEEALDGAVFPSGNVSAADKRAFVQKLAMLRGGRQTNVVVREFWSTCKGTVSSFG